MTIDEPIPPAALERVETHAMARGWRPPDIPGEWTRYLGKSGSLNPRARLLPGWAAWLVTAEQFARRDADRDKERAKGEGKALRSHAEAKADVGYTPPPKGPPPRRFREEREQAAPAPLAYLAKLQEALS